MRYASAGVRRGVRLALRWDGGAYVNLGDEDWTSIEDCSHVPGRAVRPSWSHVDDLHLVTAFSSSAWDSASRAAPSWRPIRRHIDRHPGLSDGDRHAAAARRRSGIELPSLVRPDHQPGPPTTMATRLGLRSVCLVVDDLRAAVDDLAADG